MNSEAHYFARKAEVRKQPQKAAEQKVEAAPFVNESQSVGDISAIIENLIGSKDGRDFQLAAEQIRRLSIGDVSGPVKISAAIREALVADDLEKLIAGHLTDKQIELVAHKIFRDFLEDVQQDPDLQRGIQDSIDQAFADVEGLGQEPEPSEWFIRELQSDELTSDNQVVARDILGKIYQHIFPEKADEASEPMPINIAKYADKIYTELKSIRPALLAAKEMVGKSGGNLRGQERTKVMIAWTKYQELVKRFVEELRNEFGK